MSRFSTLASVPLARAVSSCSKYRRINKSCPMHLWFGSVQVDALSMHVDHISYRRPSLLRYVRYSALSAEFLPGNYMASRYSSFPRCCTREAVRKASLVG